MPCHNMAEGVTWEAEQCGSSGLSSSSYKATDATLRAGLKTLSIPNHPPKALPPDLHLVWGLSFQHPNFWDAYSSPALSSGVPGEVAGDIEGEALPKPVMESEGVSNP